MSDTRYFVDNSGRYVGAFGDGAEPPAGSFEVPQPPDHGFDSWSFVNKRWVPWERPAEKKRLEAYEKELGSIGDQFDAIYKAVQILIPALVKSGAISPEIAAQFTPNPDAPIDTPPGWIGKVSEIKNRFPKES